MKKFYSSFLLMIFFAVSMNAQVVTSASDQPTVISTFEQPSVISKAPVKITPEAGDWAISIDAVPFLNYLGNFIGGDGLNVSPQLNLQSPNQTITAKYFVEDNMAYRLGVALNIGSSSVSTEVPAIPTTSPETFVKNKKTDSGFNLGFSMGIEKRRGYGRLFGLYGVEGGLSFGTEKTSYSYGNVLSNDNPMRNRLANEKEGMKFGLGARAFAGIEYFILPKISISGELGWGPEIMIQGRSSQKLESWDLSSAGIKTEVRKGSSNSFNFKLDNIGNSPIFGPNGQLKLSFHI